MFTLILEITGCLTKTNAALALLSVDIEIFPSDLRSLVMHILFATRLMIFRKWRGTLIPNLSDVKLQINLNFNMNGIWYLS